MVGNPANWLKFTTILNPVRANRRAVTGHTTQQATVTNVTFHYKFKGVMLFPGTPRCQCFIETAREQQAQVLNAAQIIANALGINNEGEEAPEGEGESQVEHGDADTSAEEGSKIILAKA